MLTEIIHSLTPMLSTPPSFSPISSILRHWCRQMLCFGNGMLSTSRLGFDFSCLHPLTWYIYLPLATYVFASWPPGCSYIAYDTYCFCPGYAYSFCRPRRYSSLAVAFMPMIVLAPCRLTIFLGCWCSIPDLATLGSSSLAVVFCCALFFASIHPVYSCHWLSSPGLCDAPWLLPSNTLTSAIDFTCYGRYALCFQTPLSSLLCALEPWPWWLVLRF